MFLLPCLARDFDFMPGEEGDEVRFINPEEILLQKSEVDAPARAYAAHVKWQEVNDHMKVL